MAERPVFVTDGEKPYYKEVLTTFEFHPGFSIDQKQKSIRSLQDSFIKNTGNDRILEISSKSDNELGVKLSAFSLKIKTDDNRSVFLESAFQSSKKFVSGGPYRDIMFMPPYLAKKDERIRKEGDRLIDFVYPYKGADRSFSTEPKSFFYDWLYVNAVSQDDRIMKSLVEYDAFTDIEFNPKKSFSCQARSAAILVSIYRKGILDKCLESPESFMSEIYSKPKKRVQTVLDCM